MWLLLFYALLPQIIFAAVVAAAITLAVFRRKSLFLSIPLVLSLAAWVYVELRVGTGKWMRFALRRLDFE